MSRARRRRELSSASDAMSVSRATGFPKKNVFSDQETKMYRFLHAHIFFQGLDEMISEIGLGLPQSHLTELCVHVPVSSVQSIDTLYCSVTLSLYMYGSRVYKIFDRM